MFWRFFLPGGYSPDKILRGLARDRARPGNIAGFHAFTFNELPATEQWRREVLARHG